MTNEDIIVEMDETYTFTVSEKVSQDYRMSTQIIEWLQRNIASLTDDNDKVIFSKVNTGFDSDSLKTFGKGPVCDVYINRVSYEGDFDNHTPQKVHSIIIFILRGANNVTYEKACELHDYIMQEFIENEDFRRLDYVVRDTLIDNSQLMTQPVRKNWSIMGTFELTHLLY